MITKNHLKVNTPIGLAESGEVRLAWRDVVQLEKSLNASRTSHLNFN